MEVKVAVLVDENGTPTSIKEPGVIKIYTRINKQWNEICDIEYSLDTKKSLNEVRNDTQEIIKSLGDCKIFVASEVTGILYNSLEKADFKVWEINDKPYEFLDYVAEKSTEVVPEVIYEKKEIIISEDGSYNIDIRKFQQNNVGLTSKQALRPLLNNEKIKKLNVICDHIPHWLSGEAKKLGRRYEVFEEKNKIYTVKIERIE